MIKYLIMEGFMINAYEIYALKYVGPLTSLGALTMRNKDWDKVVSRNYYLWCIKGDNVNNSS